MESAIFGENCGLRSAFFWVFGSFWGFCGMESAKINRNCGLESAISIVKYISIAKYIKSQSILICGFCDVIVF